MNNNSISISVYLKDNSFCELLENSDPKSALNFFYPDSSAPVVNLIIKAMIVEGKLITLSITDDIIYGSID